MTTFGAAASNARRIESGLARSRSKAPSPALVREARNTVQDPCKAEMRRLPMYPVAPVRRRAGGVFVT